MAFARPGSTCTVVVAVCLCRCTSRSSRRASGPSHLPGEPPPGTMLQRPFLQACVPFPHTCAACGGGGSEERK